MKHPSPADIEEMRARGYDRSTIEQAVEQSKHAVCRYLAFIVAEPEYALDRAHIERALETYWSE